MRTRALLGTAAAGATAAALTIGYASVVERNWFALRRHDVPVLAPGSAPLRVLHISDAHLTPGRHRLMSWIRELATLDPDLVVNTGDSVVHEQALELFLDSLGPLLDVPGVFVYGSNDLYAPRLKNPAHYLWRDSSDDHDGHEPTLPYEKLGASMAAAGWLDANNHKGTVKAGGLAIAVAGVDDPHLLRDNYDLVAGPADPDADLRLGVMHSPEPRLMDQFVADGYDLLLAGHTHGGQICLPVGRAIATNCGIDRPRASGLHRHPSGSTSPGGAWLNVSAGLGTSPTAPVRLFCRPEATLLTLVPRIS